MGGAGSNVADFDNHKSEEGSHFMFLPKYAYSDLTVYMQIGKNDYLNITDYSVSDKENEHITIQSEAPFVIMFCSSLYTAFGRDTKPYVCDITFDELLELSGVCDRKFRQYYFAKFGNDSKEFFAILCAKKLLDYQCGKIIRESNHKYSFYRQEYAKEMGKYEKRKKLVFTKDFYMA